MSLIPGYEDGMQGFEVMTDWLDTYENHFLQISFNEKMYVAIQLAQALVYVHTATPSLVHGDIKPSNVLVG